MTFKKSGTNKTTKFLLIKVMKGMDLYAQRNSDPKLPPKLKGFKKTGRSSQFWTYSSF